MSVLPYHKRYHSDALTGMMSLTLEERGAYNTLLDLIYDRGGPMLDNERLLAGHMNCSIRKWRQVREALIEKQKIYINSEGLIANRRARKEIENQSRTHRKLIEAGSKGGRTRAENTKLPNENKGDGQADLELGLSDPQAIRALPEARSQNTVDKESTAAEAATDPVKIIFNLGLSLLTEQGYDERAARSLIGSWRKGRRDGDVVAALVDAQAGSISNLVEWMPKRLSARGGNGFGAQHGSSIVDQVLAEKEREERRMQQHTTSAGGPC